MKLLLSDIAPVVNGELMGQNSVITGVSIDSRTLRAGELYIALPGKNFDGHQFINNAAQRGAAAALVEKLSPIDLPQILVKNSRLALAELAGFWRRQHPIKIIGVTGSNGKTTVKEMIAAILSVEGATLFTQGNLNNDIGVPLTLLKLNELHRFAVIEMGANHAGEIAYSSRFAQADIALINNVSAAHIEGFGNLDVIATSKGEIVSNLKDEGIAVLNCDDSYYPLWLEMAGNRQTICFGFNEIADVSAENISTQLNPTGFETQFVLKYNDAHIAIKLQLAGHHNVKNALAAVAATLPLGINVSSIKLGLGGVKPVVGRMQVLSGRKGNIVIDDTYNANPASLQAALQALNNNSQPNWLILGAFGELGHESADIHRKMGEMIKSMSVQRLFAVGTMAQQTVEAFGFGGHFYDSQAQLIDALTETITGKETLLVKGSRSQKMENIVAALVDDFRAA